MHYDKKDDVWHKREILFPMYGVHNFVTKCGERGYVGEESTDTVGVKCEKCEASNAH